MTTLMFFRFQYKSLIERSILYAALFITIFFALFLTAQKTIAGSDEFIFGVTIDDPWYSNEQEKNEIRDALVSHAVKPTVRFVFDECMYPVDKCVSACNGECWDPSDYQQPLENIASASFVMGEILDSSFVKDYSVEEYIERTNEYLDRFENIIDIWEIGNEVNGDWLGATADVVAKIEGAYAAVKDRGRTAALNLYYNKSCLYDKPEHEMFAWVQANISEEMKNGLDYVFFSYYEDDCENVIHTQGEWQEVFDALHAIFPKAKLGFGEVGTIHAEKKAEYMQRYYSLDIKGDYYVGGYFWWYYKQDCVPKTTELWSVLNTILLERENRSLGWLMPALLLLL
ncbi:Transmembrane protein [Candidatus Electrothrix laxa]